MVTLKEKQMIAVFSYW